MKNYLISLMAVAAVATLAGLIAPDGGKKTGLRLVTGICVLLVAITPIIQGLRALTDPDLSFLSLPGEERQEEYESLFEDGIREAGGAYLAQRLCEALAARYSCPVSDFSVRFSFSENGESVTSVLVLLRGRAVFLDTYDLEKYVEKLFSCPVTTAVGGD